MRARERPEVSAWLADFDRAARVIPEPRRGALHTELAMHLDDAIPAGATDPEVALVLADLGDPAGIVADEVDAAERVEVPPRPPMRGRSLAIGATALVVVAVLIALVLPAILSAMRFATAP
jgi:hypothetical protein